MPHLRYHRRHHSWPDCGSDICTPRNFKLLVSKPGTGATSHAPCSFQPVTTLVSEDESGDDAELAGIIRAKTQRTHRLWPRSIPREEQEDVVLPSAPSAEARSQLHRNVLRRLIRRPTLDKTRSLFVMPTTVTFGGRVQISGWMPPRKLARPLIVTDKKRTALSGVHAERSVSARRHRRCHSEQPRSWREPSASLWTLQEE